MAFSAKDLAKELGLSPAAVSMALNDKPGVSEMTRKLVIEKAKEKGFDFSRLKKKGERGEIAFVIYKKHGAVVAETSFFSDLTDGMSLSCREEGYALSIHYLFDSRKTNEELKKIAATNVKGMIILGTEMKSEDLGRIENIVCPIVILDTYQDNHMFDYVLINNRQGAYLATSYLISQRKCQPGYLRSSYPIGNFDGRADGFYKAIRENGFSSSKAVVHYLAPSIEGSYSDMCALLDSGEAIAPAYFADNDLIAAGAMRALKSHGYRIPEDVAIVGFDNTAMCEVLDPPLTTINVPKRSLARAAVKRLIEITSNDGNIQTKTEIMTSLVKRKST